MNKEKDSYEDIGRFLNQYPIENYQVQVDDSKVSKAGVTELMTLLRGCTWKADDLESHNIYSEPYTTIGIKAKGVRKELKLSVGKNGIDPLSWGDANDPQFIGSAVRLDICGTYEQYTMHAELIPKINEIIFQTIADFKNIELVDTLRVIVKRIDHTVGGLVESTTMSDEDSAEFLRLYNHAIRSTSHLGGDLLYEQPSGVEYVFVYGQNALLQISNYPRNTHKYTECIFSQAEAKAMERLESKYTTLLDSMK